MSKSALFQLRAAAEKTRQEQLQQLKTQEVGLSQFHFLLFPDIADRGVSCPVKTDQPK